MKKFGTIALASVIAVSSAVSVAAQATAVRQGNETALQMANRIGACDTSGGITSAAYTDAGSMLRVTCVGGGLSGGLSTGGAIALGVVTVALIAAAASGGSSGSSTSGTGS